MLVNYLQHFEEPDFLLEQLLEVFAFVFDALDFEEVVISFADSVFALAFFFLPNIVIPPFFKVCHLVNYILTIFTIFIHAKNINQR